jgi:hypothetical protein
MLISLLKIFMESKSNRRELQLISNSVKLRLESYYVQMLPKEALISLKLTGLFNSTLPMIPKIIFIELVVPPVELTVKAAPFSSY